ncbi:MAG: hypothetical protein ACTHQE_15680, partial [Thermomicrobiales bacterium]
MTHTSSPVPTPTATRRPWRHRALQTTLALALGGSSIVGAGIATMAQDGSGGATPIPTPAATCTIPDLSAAKPQVQPTVSPTATTTTTSTAAPTRTSPASPAASPASGTPVGSPAASPVATTPAAASPAAETPDSLQAELTLSA